MSDMLQLYISCQTGARTAAGLYCLTCVILEICVDLMFA